MVQINEIRYKNYFETVKNSSIIQISGFRTYSTDNPLVRYENHGGEYGLDQIKPIKITNEILIKFGFKSTFDGEFYSPYQLKILGYGITLTYRFSARKVVWINNDFSVEIKYVHQLQNLFFTLCGEDLVFSSTE